MIIYTELNPSLVTSYHTETHLKDIAAKVLSITSTEEYIALKEDITVNGIQDSMIAMSTPTRQCMVEVGEQRLLIARELNLDKVPLIVYFRYRTTVPSFITDYITITNVTDLEAHFADQAAPGLVMLKTYLEAGICNFDILNLITQLIW